MANGYEWDVKGKFSGIFDGLRAHLRENNAQLQKIILMTHWKCINNNAQP